MSATQILPWGIQPHLHRDVESPKPFSGEKRATDFSNVKILYKYQTARKMVN